VAGWPKRRKIQQSAVLINIYYAPHEALSPLAADRLWRLNDLMTVITTVKKLVFSREIVGFLCYVHLSVIPQA